MEKAPTPQRAPPRNTPRAAVRTCELAAQRAPNPNQAPPPRPLLLAVDCEDAARAPFLLVVFNDQRRLRSPGSFRAALFKPSVTRPAQCDFARGEVLRTAAAKEP